jgi:hypothetical protein
LRILPGKYRSNWSRRMKPAKQTVQGKLDE